MKHDLLSRRRLYLLVFFSVVWAGIVVGRSIQISIIRGSEYVARAEKQQERKLVYHPKRGEILDRHGRELAISVAAKSIFATPQAVVNRVETAALLAEYLDVDSVRLMDLLGRDKDFVYLARKVDLETAEKVQALGLPGIHFLPDSRRVYPRREMASQVLGFVGTDDIGLAGLEYQYEEDIRGRPGIVTLFRDARTRSGFNVWKHEVRQEPQPGRSIRLTIDASLQFMAERALDRGARKANALSGSVIILHPRTGAALALASWPRFDAEGDDRGDAASYRLRPLMDSYEPGSTFKAVTLAAAFELGLASPEDQIDCGNGRLVVGERVISESLDQKFGVLSLAEAVAVSSNIAMVRIGQAVGEENFHRKMITLGLGHKTGIDLLGENPGILRPVEKWSDASLASMSFGQELSVTPLQLATTYAAIANGGVLHRPYVVQSVLDADGTEFRGAPPQVSRRVLEESSARELTSILEGVVADGTGNQARVPGYRVAGKTGTAQKAIDGKYSDEQVIASFVGYLPVAAPRLVILVVIDEPEGKIHGGDVAAPIFQEIATWAMSYLRVAPDDDPSRRMVTARLDREPTRVPDEAIAQARSIRGPAEGQTTVPDLTGLDLRRAVTLLTARGLVPETDGSGTVLTQDPPAGADIPVGSVCRLELEDSEG